MMMPATILRRRLVALAVVALAAATLTACVWPNHRYYVHPRPVRYSNADTQATSPPSHYAPDRGQASGQNLRYRQVPVTYDQAIRAGYVLLDGGNHAGALQAFRDAVDMKPWMPDAWYHLACAFNRWADENPEADGESSVDLRERAFESLDQAVVRGWTDLEHMNGDPDLATLRATPEYRTIALRIHRQLGHAAYIGIQVDDSWRADRIDGRTDEPRGVIVRHVQAPVGSADRVVGPAPNGLQVGDRIVAFDLMPVHSEYDLREALATKRPGDVVVLQVERNGETLELTFMLGARPGERNRFLPTRPAPDPEATDTERPLLTSVDGRDGYVVINRGSEQGVETGMVLTVTRSGAIRAQVEVLDVQPWKSYGRVIREMPETTVAAGDHVRPPTIRDAGWIDDAIRAARPHEPAPQPQSGREMPLPDDTVADPAPEAPVAPTPTPEADAESEAVTDERAPTRADAPKPRVITVQDLIDMSVAGLSDNTLIAMIKASHIDAENADVAIHELRDAGLSDHVLAAVRIRMSKQR